jgi:hypothetical protein
MIFVDNELRSMAQYLCDATFISYPVLPLESDPKIFNILEADP